MKPTFSDRHVVVTGGGRGIGAAIAARFASEGAKLSLLGRNGKTLERHASELGELYNVEVHFFSVDVSNQSEVTSALLSCEQSLGPVEILVNNAGLVESAPFSRTDTAIWEKMIGINLSGVYYCTSHVLPRMLSSGFGRIVNIASTAGITGYPYVSAYCAAKHGVIGLTRALAIESAGSGVTINAICPGYTDTDLVSGAVKTIGIKTQQSEEAVRERLMKNVPQGRFVKPSEVASAACWLCEDDQSSITGAILNISGGEVL